MNKANCTTCAHIKHTDGGYCYMFKMKPNQTCGLHTGKIETVAEEVGSLMLDTNMSDEDFKRTATDILAKMFASI